MVGKSRRKLIKGLGISIPTAWATPIIEAVLLPAHAQSSAGGNDRPQEEQWKRTTSR